MSRAEKFIEDYTRSYSNELCAVEDRFGRKVISYHEWLTPEQALRAVEIEREELIEKACEWIKEHKEAVETEDHGIMGWIPDYFIEDFKKHMEEDKI